MPRATEIPALFSFCKIMSYIIPPPALTIVPVKGSGDTFPVRRVFCVGRNYAAHAIEMGFDPNREPPFFFCKPTDAVMPVHEGETLELPYPSETQNFHYETELVAAIGKGGSYIALENALEHVLGYAVGLDMTRRDLQKIMRETSRPWEIAKALDRGAPIGPITKAAQCHDIHHAAIQLQVNGVIKQASHINKMTWNVAEIITHLSRFFRLEAGDLIYTGTPEGVGPVVVGDTMLGSIEGLGTLSVKVI